MGTTLEPTAQGNLSTTPLAHLLVYVLQHKLNGTLAIWPSSATPSAGADHQQHRILFREGRPIAGRLLVPSGNLQQGMLQLFNIAEAPYAFYSDRDLVGNGSGTCHGSLEPLSLIAAWLRGPVREDVIAGILERLGSTKLRLQPGVDLRRFQFLPREQAFLELLRAGPASAQELIDGTHLDRDAAQRMVYLLAITKTVQSFDPRQAQIASRRPAPSGMSARPAAQSLPPRTQVSFRPSVPSFQAAGVSVPPVVRSIRPSNPSFRPGSLPPVRTSLRPSGSTPPVRASLRPSSPSFRPGGSSPPARNSLRPSSPSFRPGTSSAPYAIMPEGFPSPPADLTQELKDRWFEVGKLAVMIEDKNYFEMLDLRPGADIPAVRTAYFEAVKKWHPDRLPAALGILLPYIQSIFRYLTEAHATLSDNNQRDLYMYTLQDGGGSPNAMRRAEAAARSVAALQSAQTSVRRHDYSSALEEARAALELNPDDFDALALFGWLTFLMRGNSASAVEEAFECVVEVLKKKPEHEHAHYYKAMILKATGRESEALKHFRAVVRLNPNNVDAAREVRLANMRKSGTHASKSSKPGLFSKLFEGKETG